MIVNYENFESAMAEVLANKAAFYIASCTKIVKITAKTIKSFKSAGYDVIKKDVDGKGFRMQSGKKALYVFPGQLAISE